MGAAAAIIIRRQRDVVDTYRAAGATSPGTARDPGELGVEQNLIFRGLVRRAVLRDAGNGRYYLDAPSWDAFNGMRRRAALVLGLSVVLVVVLLVLLVLAGIVHLH
jgi:hypothetical protein